jgi:hypothetical protein
MGGSHGVGRQALLTHEAANSELTRNGEQKRGSTQPSSPGSSERRSSRNRDLSMMRPTLLSHVQNRVSRCVRCSSSFDADVHRDSGKTTSLKRSVSSSNDFNPSGKRAYSLSDAGLDLPALGQKTSQWILVIMPLFMKGAANRAASSSLDPGVAGSALSDMCERKGNFAPMTRLLCYLLRESRTRNLATYFGQRHARAVASSHRVAY